MSRSERNQLSRRGLLAGAGVVAAGALGAGLIGASPATAAPAAPSPDEGGPEATPFGPVSIRPGDSRYDSMLRGDNFRFVGDPDEVRVVSSTAAVVAAVGDAVRAGKQIAVRSGGHCFENFTADPSIKMLVDISPMDAVGFDPKMGAFVVEPGATLGRVYTALYKGWGVTIPAGGCPEVGAGGHFLGGGYGPLSRRYGSVVDHLHAVEVVVVGADGTARAVVATRDPHDPNNDLFWAHTGGGGGNFGVVTRYWLRSPGATGTNPAQLLPPAPAEMLGWLVEWVWDEHMTEQAFTTLLRNFGVWHENNSAPGTPADGMYPILIIPNVTGGGIQLVVQMDAGLPNAQGMLNDLIAAVNAGTGLTPAVNTGVTMPWLHMTTWPGDGEGGDKTTRRYKLKAGYLRKSLTDAQLSTIYTYLSNPANPSGGMLFVGYGGQVQAIAPDATAVAQRDVVMKAVYQTYWSDESDDAGQLAWIRSFYRDIYAATGGVPVPNDVSDGSYINYPDADLADPAWNTSGVPWSTLYYKDNYPRLQQVKAKWDPRDIFHHALSIELPS